jgi:glyoxylase-like metal-dependent hydrolase (beta-lactamase superfamily II)
MKGMLAAALLLISTQVFAGPRLYVFDCGAIEMDSLEMFGLQESESSVRQFFIPCYLVQHEKGLLLWDGGLPKDIADAEGPVLSEGMTMRYDRWIADQLSDMGIALTDVTHAAYSHLHLDHAGAANAFAGSEVIMQQKEWDAAFGEKVAFVETTLFEGLKGAKVPTFNVDPEQTLASMDKIEQLLKDSNAVLWIEHDKALADTLKMAPLYYD